MPSLIFLQSRKHANKVRLYYMLHPVDGGCPAKKLRTDNVSEEAHWAFNVHAFATSTDSKPVSFLITEAGSFITPSRNSDIATTGKPFYVHNILIDMSCSSELITSAQSHISHISGYHWDAVKVDQDKEWLRTFCDIFHVTSCQFMSHMACACLWFGLLKVYRSYKMVGLNGYICNILANFACSFVLRQLFPTKATCIKKT